MKLTFLYYESSNTNPFENSPDQPPVEHPRDTRAGKYIQIVHHDLKRSKLQNFLEKHHTC